MSTNKLLSVLVIISIGRVNSLHLLQEYYTKGNEVHNPLRIYVYEDSAEELPDIPINRNIITLPPAEDSDLRRTFLVSRNSSPTENEMNVGVKLFGIPLGFKISHTKDKDVTAVPSREEVVEYKPVSIPGEATINGEGYEANNQKVIYRVPAKELKKNIISTLYAKNPATHTFSWEQDYREPMIFADEPTRRNEKVSAGLQIFGVPLGPQFTYDKNDGQGQDSDGPNSQRVAESYSISDPVLAAAGKLAKSFVSQIITGW